MQRLKSFSLRFLIAIMMMFTLSFGLHQSYAGADAKTEIQQGVNQANGGNSTATPAKPLNDTITSVVNLLSSITGVLAVIMIVYGGLRYVTSGGASDKVGNAKNIILYALIGLAVVALAQFIVKFVLNHVTS